MNILPMTICFLTYSICKLFTLDSKWHSFSQDEQKNNLEVFYQEKIKKFRLRYKIRVGSTKYRCIRLEWVQKHIDTKGYFSYFKGA
jgi:hypothetical protein